MSSKGGIPAGFNLSNRWIQLLLEDKQYFGREDYNVPISGHYNITTFQSVIATQVAR